MTTTLPNNHKWLFVLLNKQTCNAGWWLKIQTQNELAAYLELTSSKYARAFDNFWHDSFYQPSVVGHGKHIQESQLTLASYLYGVNRHQSMIEALTEMSSRHATQLYAILETYGAVYMNSRGGYQYNPDPSAYTGDFYHNRNLVWPQLDETSIRIESFPGGKHFYAYIGDIQVRDGDMLKFNTYEKAMAAAKTYLCTQQK